MSRRIPNPPGTRPCCTMPYYPSPGVDVDLHSDSSETYFYVVERGFVVGTYTDAKIATQQVEGYRGGFRVKVPRFDDAKVQWAAMCAADHGFICPVAAAEQQVLVPTAPVYTAASSTPLASFSAAQRKFVLDAVSGKPTPLPGVQATTVIPAASQPTARATTTTYASSSAAPPGISASSGSSKGRPTASTSCNFGTGAAAFSKMGDGPPVNLHWGVKGVFRTYASQLDAVAVARKLNIPDTDIISDPDAAFVEAWSKCTSGIKRKSRAASCRASSSSSSTMPKVVATKRAKKTRTEPKQKPGNKGDFHGRRETFLTSQLPEYFQKSKQRKTREFWPQLFKVYMELFSWRLELNEDPDPEDGLLREALSLEEMDLKAEKIKQVKAKIKTWFNHQRSAAGLARNPFAEWLTRLRRPNEPCPKRISDYQYYMQHNDFKDKVAEEFKAKYPDVVREEALAARCKVARALFEQESEEVKARMREEAGKEHESLVETWQEAEEGLPSVDEEDQEEARRRFSATVTPLLEALREYTGYYIALIAGRAVEGKFDVLSVHAGKTKALVPEKEQDITQWNPAGYERILNEFVRFINAACLDPKSEGAQGTNIPDTQDGEPAPVPQALPPPLPVPLPVPVPPIGPVPLPVPVPPIGPTMLYGVPADGPAPLLPEMEDEMSLINPATRRPVTPPPAGNSLAARMGRLAIMNTPLRESLEALSPVRKEARIAALEGLSGMALQRENNDARRDKGLRLVAEEAAGEGVEDRSAVGKPKPSANPKPRKKAARGGKAKRGKRRVRDEDESDSANETPSGDESDEVLERVDAPTTRGRAKAEGAANTAPANAQGSARDVQMAAAAVEGEQNIEGEGSATDIHMAAVGLAAEKNGSKGGSGDEVAKRAPTWAVEGKSSLEKGTEEWGERWTKATSVWWSLEESTDFISSTRGFAPSGRPSEVGYWVKCARKGAPNILDVKVFATQWLRWWGSINPKWRVGVDGSLKRVEEGAWEEMERPGANGFLSVLICLRWWKEAGGGGDWTDAVEDVTWAMER
ncbi:hypothetical protein C8F04DRAFT_1189686 [Mycena alexandri]|uniref:Uncharacterized protein n=1 Tax=Mycena alexandri TaxID=1745969 RepID=A0AAD6WZZ7_9AGAR|nr:hypothetical protein C8F04DRAFT_1189686 [Mycena alexandri]